MSPRRARAILAIAASGLALVSGPAQADSWEGPGGHAAERSGDLLQFGIPIIGLGLTYLLTADRDKAELNFSSLDGTPGSSLDADGFVVDWPGPGLNGSTRHDFLVSFLRMEVTTYGLKYAIDAERPNGGGQSFPSGHTASAFMGAEFIRKEFGWGWGVPAYAAAGWVGYTRVQSHNHYWRDVLGGALIGIASNHDFSGIDTPLGHLSLTPTMMSTEPSTPAKLGYDDFARTSSDAFPVAPGFQIKLDFKP